MKLNNRFIFGILSLLLAAVIAFVALPTIARQTNGKEEIVDLFQISKNRKHGKIHLQNNDSEKLYSNYQTHQQKNSRIHSHSAAH